MTIRMNFEHELEMLKLNLEEMGGRVELIFDKLYEGIDKQDEELIKNIIKNDRTINDMEKNIEAKCLSLITKQQPMASDLRMVSASLKVVTDLERIADHAADIAELALRLLNEPIWNYSKSLKPMMESTRKMVHNAVDAFVNRDEQAAKAVIAYDDVIDEYFNNVKYDVVNLLKQEDKNPDNYIDILMIAKYLERAGDHGVNIGDWEIFQETGIINHVRLL
ncbi:MAG: phosphate signaling complex protein PhoU [Lachnospiraceae bacterium]|nr:phosphate signaling complex protein PhoU [Lachnospiraceae bacterium]